MQTVSVTLLLIAPLDFASCVSTKNQDGPLEPIVKSLDFLYLLPLLLMNQMYGSGK